MGNIVTGNDGVTSIPINKRFTSSSSNFILAGVRIGDFLHIEDPDNNEDNDRYIINDVTQNYVTVNKEFPSGSLINLKFRIQQIEQKYSTFIDYTLLKNLDREFYYRAYTKKQWYIFNQLTNNERNIYGEPLLRTLISNNDGITSNSNLRTLTSPISNFISSGVHLNSKLSILNTSDAGIYTIIEFTNNTLIINSNWPVGNNNNISFTITQVGDFYTKFPILLPFYVKLEPTQNMLSKYGIDNKRDALFIIPISIAEDHGLFPKIGDAFSLYSENKLQLFEVLTLSKTDIQSDMNNALHYVGTAEKKKNNFE